jgi:hypothetical protein
VGAKLFQVVLTGIALLTGIDHTSNPNKVAGFEAFHFGPHPHYPADDLMAGDYRIHGIQPLVARGVDVAMANPAIRDFYMDIAWPGSPPLNLHFF